MKTTLVSTAPFHWEMFSSTPSKPHVRPSVADLFEKFAVDGLERVPAVFDVAAEPAGKKRPAGIGIL